MTRLQVADRVAMVTGAARGAGRATAVAYAKSGAEVILLDLCHDLPDCPYPMGTAAQLDETAELCREAGAQVVTVKADVREPADVRAAVDAGLAAFGRIDVLVNNAGIVGPAGTLAHQLPEEHWALLLDVNLTGSWRCAKAVLATMVEQRAGSIINIASTAGSVAFRHFAGYVAAKHGVIGLTRALAVDYAPYGIRVNAICPTSIYDDPSGPGMLDGVAGIMGVGLPEYEQTSQALHPMNTLVYADDVAAAALWLGSDAAARATGTLLTIDAGFTAR